MQPTNNKRFYTPQFSELAAVSIRRLAWALDVSMPKAIDHIVHLLPKLGGAEKVCLSCKDKTKCAFCTFCPQNATEEQSALLAAL